MFSVHTTPAKFENETITGRFAFAFEKTRAGKSRDYYDVTVSKMSLSTLKRKAAVFKLKSVFEKLAKL